MTEGQKTILAIQREAVHEALGIWLCTPISTPMGERMEMALAAYEHALIRPIAEAPKDGTAILIIDCSDGSGWCEDGWNVEFNTWDVCPDSNPTHFRPLPQQPEFPETANAK